MDGIFPLEIKQDPPFRLDVMFSLLAPQPNTKYLQRANIDLKDSSGTLSVFNSSKVWYIMHL